MASRYLIPLLFAGLLTAKSVVPSACGRPKLEVQWHEDYAPEGGFYEEPEVAYINRKHVPQGDSPEPGESPTIYAFLQGNPHFSKLAKVVNISSEIVSILNDTSSGVTFFAVPDWALKPPHRKRPHKELEKKTTQDILADMGQDDLPAELADVISRLEDSGEFEKPDDEEERKKFIKKIITAILSYNIIPGGLDSEQLASNVTFATNLTLPDGSLDGQPLRIRTFKGGIPHNALYINFVSKVVKPNVRTGNGIIHVVNHPVFPPPSIFQEAFLFPKAFSYLTSAVQRVDLTGALDLWWNKEEKKLEGNPATTVFAPSNQAFEGLPRRLQFFLFSPFGSRVLKKLLDYHVVPHVVVHSDYIHNVSSVRLDSVSKHVDLDGMGRVALNSFLVEETNRGSMKGDFYLGGENEEIAGMLDILGYNDGYMMVDHLPQCWNAEWEENFDWTSEDDRGSSSSCQCGPYQPRQESHRSSGSLPHYRLPPLCLGPGSHLPHPVPVYAVNLTLPTLLTNHTLDVHIAKFKLTIPLPGKHKIDKFYSVLSVNGQRVRLSDLPARNGAVHVIGRILDPRPHPPPPPPNKPKGGGRRGGFYESEASIGWEDWEDWLPQWADEN